MRRPLSLFIILYFLLNIQAFANNNIHTSITRIINSPMPLELEYAYARNKVWIYGLKKASIKIKNHAFGIESKDSNTLLAIAAKLFSIEDINFIYSGQNKAEIILSPKPDFKKELTLALRNPEQIQLLTLLINDIQNTLKECDRLIVKAKSKKILDFQWEKLQETLDGLWILALAFSPTDDGWLVSDNSLSSLEKANKLLPNSKLCLLLLAEARLQRHMPQQCIDACTKALMIDPSMNRARYIRALAHLRLQQLALAEDDLTISLSERFNISPQEDERAHRLRARGAVRMLRGNFEGMCTDFSEACSLGDCEGLALARKKNHCQGENSTELMTLPHTFMDTPKSIK